MSTTVNQVEKIECIEQTAVSKGNPIPVQSESTTACTVEISNNSAQQSNVDNGMYDSASLEQAIISLFNEYAIDYDEEFLQALKNILKSNDRKTTNSLLADVEDKILSKSFNKNDEFDKKLAMDLVKEYNTEVPKSEEVKNDPERDPVKELAKTLGLENVKDVSDISVAIKEKYEAACDALKENPEAKDMEEFVKWFQTALTNIPDEDKTVFIRMLMEIPNDNTEDAERLTAKFFESFKKNANGINTQAISDFVNKNPLIYGRDYRRNQVFVEKYLEYCNKDNGQRLIRDLDENQKNAGSEEESNAWSDLRSTAQVAFANSKVLVGQEQADLLKEIDLSAQQFPTYRRHLENIARYVEEHPDNISIAIKEFEELMNNASNGNYSKVVNDIKNKETTELVITKSGEDNQSGSTETGFASGTSSTSEPTGNTLGSLGFTQKELPKNISEKINNQKEPQKTPTIDENTGLDVSATPSTVQVLTTTNVKAVKKEKGILKTVYDVAVGVVKAVDEVVDELVEDIKGLGKTFQCLLLSVASGNFFNEMITNLKDSVLVKFNESGLKGRSFDQTQKIKEHFSQIESKN